MKVLLISFLTLVLFVSTACSKTDHDLSDIPKDVLEQGLKATAVCMVIEGYGIKRMLGFYNDSKDESVFGEHGKAAVAAGLLYEDFQMEKMLAVGIGKALKEKYDMKAGDIGEIPKDEIEAAQAEMKEKYDSLDTYQDFTEAYAESLDTCTNTLQSFTAKIKNEIDKLEKKESNP